MEHIEVELSEFTRRSRSTVVSHVAAGLSRGLEPGEQVVLHDATHGSFAGEVVDLEFEPADTLYRIRVGVRLGVEDALERLGGAQPSGERVGHQELLDLLGELRGRRGGRLSIGGGRRDAAL
jgi:hypothetical protein